MDTPEGLESALSAAFSDAPVEKAPPPKQARAPEPDEQVVEPVEADPADLLAGEEIETEVKPAEVAEPEYEIEIEPGKPEVLPLARLKELAARGAKAGRGFEENARVREALQAHVVNAQLQTGFQQAVAADIGQIQALENQLKAYEQINWQKEYDTDPFNALKLKEQRDQLREQRAAAIGNLNAKQQQYQAQFQENTQRLLAAENEALLAKVPAWRNPEKANQERSEIAAVLTSHYGYTPAEISQLMDHRALVVARDAAAYRKLLANKDARVKQAREAPATAKPGAAAQPNSRDQTKRVLGQVKALGTKGNHKAQEDLMTRVLGQAFK